MITNDAFHCMVDLFGQSEVAHMVTGSIAAAYYGLSRATLDVDVVIDPSPDQLRALVSLLEANAFYVSEANARTALRSRTQFNVIHIASVWKIDLVIRKDRPFSKSEFKRRLPARILETDSFVVTAEDLILAKLEWSKSSASARQIQDIEGIIEIKGESLDQEYLVEWAHQLGLTEAYRRLHWKT